MLFHMIKLKSKAWAVALEWNKHFSENCLAVWVTCY